MDLGTQSHFPVYSATRRLRPCVPYDHVLQGLAFSVDANGAEAVQEEGGRQSPAPSPPPAELGPGDDGWARLTVF